MKWEKKGLIYAPDGRFDWSVSHAQLPIVDSGYEGYWRIYYSTRNRIGQSNIGYVHVSKTNPWEIIYIHPEPVLKLGKLGTFDESGVMPVAIINFGARKYLYYAGWSLKGTIPYHNTVGLAISEDQGLTFNKYGEGPILDLKPFEPYANGTINIIVEKGLWRAWYQSITKWEILNARAEPFYHLKYAESVDGINWNRNAQVAIDFEDENEGGICSASVLQEEGKYKMWYCFRKKMNYRSEKENSYRIGYAESNNGISWLRMDKLVGIDISDKGWDSEMIAYPNIVQFENMKQMFYNGNGFGKSGFGLAILK